jgi:hypothetical protein
VPVEHILHLKVNNEMVVEVHPHYHVPTAKSRVIIDGIFELKSRFVRCGFTQYGSLAVRSQHHLEFSAPESSAKLHHPAGHVEHIIGGTQAIAKPFFSSGILGVYFCFTAYFGRFFAKIYGTAFTFPGK